MTTAEPWRRPVERPLVVGHRGASARVVENTMEAFAEARDAGADGIELDVHLCAGGDIVVFHDEDLSRLAGRGERIGDLPLSAIREVRLNHGLRIPTLDQVLAGFPDLAINIEIKVTGLGRATPLCDAVVACVRRHGADGRVLVSSFDPLAVARVRKRAPHLAVGYLFHERERLALDRGWPAALVRAHAVHPRYPQVTEERMAAWRRRGYLVNTWTVDEPEAQRRLARLGVNALITNDPASARRALGL